MSKKLAKEREEMCRDLSRLHESMIELHDQMIMEMQVMIMIMMTMTMTMTMTRRSSNQNLDRPRLTSRKLE